MTTGAPSAGADVESEDAVRSAGHRLLRASGWRSYDHSRLELRRRLIRWVGIHLVFPVTVKIQGVAGLENLPASGPAILMFNHIAFVDPLVIICLLPRSVVPLAKEELFANPFLALVPWIYKVIPVRRGEVDRRALSMALQVLHAGEVVLLAPEGTRSPRLLPGKEGVAFLAARTGAPVVPVAVEGTEGFPAIHGERWLGPGASIRLGRPFRYSVGTARPDRVLLRKMTDEALYVLASMLPPERRGAYSDLSRATRETIEWLGPAAP